MAAASTGGSQAAGSAPANVSKTAAKKAAYLARKMAGEKTTEASLLREGTYTLSSNGSSVTKVANHNNLDLLFATPDFVNCVPRRPTVPYHEQGEWKARAEYFEAKSLDLGGRLATSVHLIQAHTEQSNKDKEVLQQQLEVVRAENCRLASMLSCYVKKEQERESVDRANAEEKASMQAVLDTMSETLSCYIKKAQEDSAKRRWSGSFFATHPSDGRGAY